MRSFLIKFLLVFAAVFFGYKYRYRLLNMLLGQSFLRKMAVGSVFLYPGLKSKMINNLFD